MFKYINKVSSYGDELRVDLNLNKRSRNYRFKNKVLYLKDRIILWKYIHRFYYKYKYIVNDEFIEIEIINSMKIINIKNNILHRENDKPAIIAKNGSMAWFLNGKYRRQNSYPNLIWNNNQYWIKDNNLHREDGPAIIYSNGDKIWYYHGKRHREGDKPVYIGSNGYQSW
jgi:hypothetical protein